MTAVRYLILVAILATIGYIVYDSQFGEPDTAPGGGPASSPQENGTDPEAAALPVPSPSGFYKWTDKHGVLHYTNEPGSIPAEYRNKAVDVTLPDINMEAVREPFNPAPLPRNMQIARVTGDAGVPLNVTDPGGPPARADSDIQRTARPSDQVIVYTTDWCDECRRVLVLLNSMGVEFVERDVEKEVRHLREMLEVTGGKGRVPVLTAGKVLVVGYKPEAITLAVGKQKQR